MTSLLLELKRKNFFQSRIVIDDKQLHQNFHLDKYLNKVTDTRHVLITDKNVYKLYGKKIIKNLKNKIDFKELILEPGERSKNFEKIKGYIDRVIGFGITKDSCIVSLGGGVINNIAGFLASIIYRGINLIHIPTTILAQTDAAIDFKQATNHSKGKNLIGTLYPANYILIDSTVLSSLPQRQINIGISEIIKHALSQDIRLFDLLTKLSIKSVADLRKLILRTIDLKTNLIKQQPKNAEMIMQYGHLFGHAIEKLTSYQVCHGEAIAIGMCLSAEVSFCLGICSYEDVTAHYSIMKKFELPYLLPTGIRTNILIRSLRFDKYSKNGIISLGLISKKGRLHNEKGNYAICISKEIIKKAIKANHQRI
jgi:3-dehydroquinate synthase